jgi:hypothetical protein
MDFSEVENARVASAKRIIMINSISVIIFLISVSIGIAFSGIGLGLILVFFFSFAIAVSFYLFVHIFSYNDKLNRYKKIYKRYFVELSLKKTFDNYSYDHDSGIDSNLIFNTGMIEKGDYTSNDFVSGYYHGVNFSQADVLITDNSSDDYSIVFQGRWMIFEFPKKFAHQIEVVQNDFPDKKIPEVGPSGRKFEQYTVESPKFHDKFEIYAESGLEVFYVLDPAFIDRIETLSNNCKGEMLLCFIDNKLHIALHNRSDAFEPPDPREKIDEKVEFEKVSNEIRTITDFIDYLKLHNKIFIKK